MAKSKKSVKVKKPVKKKISSSKKPVKKKVMKKASSSRKSKKVSAIPKGYNSITPYLIIDGAGAAIEFYKQAFGAKEKMRMNQPGGKVVHAELQLGDTKIMLADACPEMNAQSPEKLGGSPVGIHLYIKDIDKVIEKTLSLGSKMVRPAQDMFYGDRSATIIDPYGHQWTISTHIEDITPAKMKKRAEEFFSKNNHPEGEI